MKLIIDTREKSDTYWRILLKIGRSNLETPWIWIHVKSLNFSSYNATLII